MARRRWDCRPCSDDATIALRVADPEDKPDKPEDEDLVPPAAEEPRIGDSRKLYMDRYAEVPLEERIALAKTVDADGMRAIAFDPVPRVISALMENPNFSVVEA